MSATDSMAKAPTQICKPMISRMWICSLGLVAEHSHEATRVRERGMRKFKSVRHAQRFLGGHAAVQNLFNLGRHLVGAELSGLRKLILRYR